MADTLRRLTSSCSYSLLQSKIERWYEDYNVISCDQNLNRCCELIEITAKIQGQLFAILNLTAAEGGHYAGVETLKTRLLPWLGTCFASTKPPFTDDTSLHFIQDSVDKDSRFRRRSGSHDSDMQRMEIQLCSTQMQLESVRAELENAQKELEKTRSKSSTTLLATEDEILQLRADLRSAHEQVEIYKRKFDALEDYEQQTRLLRDEVSYLTKEKNMLQDRLVRSCSPNPLPRSSRSSSPMRNESPTRAQLTQSSRSARLVSRFSDLYAVERLEAQILLRRHVVDLEMVQRIIFVAVVESFKTAKLAYRQLKLRVRKTLSTSYFGPESVEDATVDYILRNLDLYDVEVSVNDVINAMNVSPSISFPAEADFSLISALIRETCKVAFTMQTLDPPLDLAFASDGELYNNIRYRRSYDSDFTSPIVLYHVWPALMEGNTVILKGEAVTKRTVPWSRSRSRSRSSSSGPLRTRSLSPSRSLAYKNKRGRSPERFSGGYP